MSLTREHLESGVMRQMLSKAGLGMRCLSDDELRASLRTVLGDHCPKCDVWVFGYGSLVWNPLFKYAERVSATLHGYHRRFCLWSTMGRGTPDNPGLVLGLDRGGRCQGVAYRLSRREAEEELFLLWRREMVVGSYCPRWVKVKSGRVELRTLAFIVNRAHPNYAGKLPVERVVQSLATAQGHIGRSSDYLRNTIDALAAAGLRDAHLLELRDRLDTAT
jgi:cation transport protein ChaC